MTHAFVYSLGMALLHSLWQITIIYLLLKVLVMSFKNRPSNWKYNLSGAAMFTSFLIAALTFFIYYQGEKTDLANSYGLISGLNSQQISILSAENASMGQEPGTSGISAFLPQMVYIYLSGLLLLILRLIFSLIYLRKYRYNGIVKLDETLNKCFESLVRSFKLKKKIKIREKISLSINRSSPER
jgi:hypothetical protein